MYFQYPALHADALVAVHQEALWLIPVQGGRPERLTQKMARLAWPCWSPDGSRIAMVSQNDVWVMDKQGGQPERITLSGQVQAVIGWRDSGHIWIISNADHPFQKGEVYSLSVSSGQRQKAPIGPCQFAHFPGAVPQVSDVPGSVGPCVMQRQGYGYVSWKRYQGGLAGELWVDAQGTGQFSRILDHITHNLVRPWWVDGRIWFLSDSKGWGNLFSCTVDGSDMQQHTHHTDFCARHLSHDPVHGRWVYSAAGRLFILDGGATESRPIAITPVHGARETVRVSYDPQEYLQDFAPSNARPWMSVITRGRLFQLTSHKGPVLQLGARDGVRYRSTAWFKDNSMIVLADNGLTQSWEVYPQGCIDPIVYSIPSSCGRITEIEVHPEKRILAMTNHRHELWIHDLESGQTRHIDTSCPWPFQGFDWSSCGRFLAYARASQHRGSGLFIWDRDAESRHCVQSDTFMNTHPVFDPDGKYLYFLSARDFTPSYDSLGVSMGCRHTIKPYALILGRSLDSPFVEPLLKVPSETQGDTSETDEDKSSCLYAASWHADTAQEQKVAGWNRMTDASPCAGQEMPRAGDDAPPKTPDKSGSSAEDKPKVTQIDWEGIDRRLVAFPLPPRAYSGLIALKHQVLYIVKDEDDEKAELMSYDLNQLKEDTLLTELDAYALSTDKQWITCKIGHRLRTMRTGTKPDDGRDSSFHRGGWLDWRRIDLRVCPIQEWRHMFDEAWRLQKDHFWMPEMGQVDWDSVYAKYRPLVETIGSRDELISILWDMQGELGTSHAYVDYSDSPARDRDMIPSSLGAELVWDAQKQAYQVQNFVQGDPWHPSPLLRPGLGIKEGDWIWAIAGQRLSVRTRPDELLCGRSGQGIPLLITSAQDPACDALASQAPASSTLLNSLQTPDASAHRASTASPACGISADLQPSGQTQPRTVVVFPISPKMEKTLRYRAWVESCRQRVYERTQHQGGYVHIPDMVSHGYGEFLRGYLQDYDKSGLIIDARFNGGGNLSYMILDLLGRKRLGMDQSRHQGMFPYPSYAPRGPMVALINGYAGSDGDIFSYSFQKLGLGPLVGTRTWGGVVGIHVRYDLLDGSTTTQPEYAFWFEDTGWRVENYGVEPSPGHTVPLCPQDEAAGRDTQLDHAIDLLQTMIAQDQERQRQQRTPPALPNLAYPIPRRDS